MIKIAGVQFYSKGNVEENIKKAENFIDIAVSKGAKLVAFPELFLTEWFPCEIADKYFQLAESSKGKSISLFREYSKKYKTILIIPFFEKYKKSYFNSTAVIEKGKLIGVYRKVHIPQIPLWEEKYYFKRGNEFPVFETSIGKIGIQICWDNFFFEGYRTLALSGATLVVTPTASAFNTQSRWKMVIATQALLNNMFILRVNRVGKERHQEFYGNSFVVGPDGVIIGKPAGALEGVFISEIDLNMVKRAKKYFPFFGDRVPKLYTKISEEIYE